MLKLRTMPALILVLGLVFSATAAADAQASYREGMAAFKSADYELALRHFQQAEQEGLRSVTLYYNLGATHYRLGNYEASTRYFGEIREDAKWGALAEYNLGLTAERQNDPARAIGHYRQAYRKSDSEKVRQLARTRLSALTDTSAADEPRSWLVYLSSSVGNDDNPALVQDTQLLPTAGADTFAEVIGNVTGYLRGNRADGLRLSTGLYSRQYRTVSEFSVSGVDAGLYLDDQTASWRFVRGIRANNYWLDGNQYSTGGGLMLRATQRGNTVNLDIRNDLDFLNGGSGFDFITGVRNRLRLDLFHRRNASEWRLGYRHEYNDRNDLATADKQFFSYSPMRHAVYGQLRNDLGENWSLRTRVEYRNSRYPDANREIDAETGAVTEARRQEDRIDVSALLRFALNRSFNIFAEYRYTDNDANFDRFIYRSNQALLGVDLLF